MPSELPPDLNIPPTEFDPGDQARLTKVLTDPVGTPVHRHKIDVEERFEEIVPGTELKAGYRWFALGLAYAMIKVDRSLIEAYRDALGQSIRILTHQAPTSLLHVSGSSAWSANPWSGIIQGIPEEHAVPFIDYLTSFVFKRRDTGHDWVCNLREIEIPDPLHHSRLPVAIWVALPRNLSLRREMAITSPGIGVVPPTVQMALDTPHG